MEMLATTANAVMGHALLPASAAGTAAACDAVMMLAASSIIACCSVLMTNVVRCNIHGSDADSVAQRFYQEMEQDCRSFIAESLQRQYSQLIPAIAEVLERSDVKDAFIAI